MQNLNFDFANMQKWNLDLYIKLVDQSPQKSV